MIDYLRQAYAPKEVEEEVEKKQGEQDSILAYQTEYLELLEQISKACASTSKEAIETYIEYFKEINKANFLKEVESQREYRKQRDKIRR